MALAATPFTEQVAAQFKDAGNAAFKLGDWDSACKHYRSAITSFHELEETSDHGMIATITACYSNLCASLYKQSKWHEVTDASKAGLSLARRISLSSDATSSSTSVVTGLEAKLRARAKDAVLSRAVDAAADETRLISRLKPVVFHSRELRSALGDLQQTKYFFTGQFVAHSTDSLKTQRLLVTLSVFTCITVWAWHRQEQQGKVTLRAFGCHIPIGSLLLGASTAGYHTGVQLLPELAKGMQLCFVGVSKSEVKVSLIGGQQAMDLDPGLKVMFSKHSEQHQRFGWQVEQSVRQSGFSNIDKTLLNVFPGSVPSIESIHNWEPSLARDNQRFFAIGLDLHTGAIFAESDWNRHEELGNPTPPSITAQEAKWMQSLSRRGQPLQQAP